MTPCTHSVALCIEGKHNLRVLDIDWKLECVADVIYDISTLRDFVHAPRLVQVLTRGWLEPVTKIGGNYMGFINNVPFSGRVSLLEYRWE